MIEVPSELSGFLTFIPNSIGSMEKEVEENSELLAKFKTAISRAHTSEFLRKPASYTLAQDILEKWVLESKTLFIIAILSGDFFNTTIFPSKVKKTLGDYIALEKAADDRKRPSSYAKMLKKSHEDLVEWFKVKYNKHLELRISKSNLSPGEMVTFAPPILALVKQYWKENKEAEDISEIKDLDITIGGHADTFNKFDFPTRLFFHYYTISDHQFITEGKQARVPSVREAIVRADKEKCLTLLIQELDIISKNNKAILQEIKRFGEAFETWKSAINTEEYYGASKNLIISLFDLWGHYISTTAFFMHTVKPLIAELTEYNRFEELYPLDTLEMALDKNETLK